MQRIPEIAPRYISAARRKQRSRIEIWGKTVNGDVGRRSSDGRILRQLKKSEEGIGQGVQNTNRFLPPSNRHFFTPAERDNIRGIACMTFAGRKGHRITDETSKVA